MICKILLSHSAIMESECQENTQIRAHLAFSLLSHLDRSKPDSQSEPKVKQTPTNEHPSLS